MLFVLSLGIGLAFGSLFLGIVLLIDRHTRTHNKTLEAPLSSWN